ncbi:MAG: hypothetical protein KKD07_00885 [Candidatus Omnitrophica bacterium]|nr:hypothetical protein [Candidatus Omnitrophota bacterium]MBU4332977.1 hypothetical protein [Candidatus Omnitrophota bacterium]
MNAPNTNALIEELEQFRQEKQKIRDVVGQIGGSAESRLDKIINVMFVILITLLFFVDSIMHFFNIPVSLPPMISIEVGLLLVSVKIIWMIHKQTKVNHFQFWILNSIEFRLNDLSKDIKEIKKSLKDQSHKK